MRHLRLTPEERQMLNRRRNFVILTYTTMIIAGVTWAALRAPSLEQTREARAISAVTTANTFVDASVQ